MKTATLLMGCFVMPVFAGATTIVQERGQHPSPNQECMATIGIADMGGFFQLSIAPVGFTGPTKAIDDINGFAWIDSDTFVYAGSRTPGLFAGTCAKDKPVRIRLIDRPKHYLPGHRKPLDFYELESIEGREIRYYYAPYSHAVDFYIFRQPEHVKSITLSPRSAPNDPLGVVPGSSRYVSPNPIPIADSAGLSALFDRGEGTITIALRNGKSVTYVAANNAMDLENYPGSLGQRGTAPNGTWPVQRPIPTPDSKVFGPYFWPIGDHDAKGSGLDIARHRGIGIHGGRVNFQSKTYGSIRMNDDDILDLFRRTRNDPVTKITIR